MGEGKYLEALKVITARNPLPFITGTICSQHCAKKCTRAFYEGSINIRCEKLEAAEKAYAELMNELKITPQAAKSDSKSKIAIIGGGPAGLAAAYFLAKEGITVTIFEKRENLGGIVKFVIPDFRIGKTAIDNDLDFIKAMGIEVQLNTSISNLDELKAKGYDKIIIATGAWKPTELKLEGGKTIGALEFMELYKANPKSLKLGENVVVIGGGNTAMDAARVAKQALGVKNVSLVYRRTKRYMPADGEELKLALEDGVQFKELLAPKSLKNGILTCELMELLEPDTTGRRRPVSTGKTVEIPANTVITAIGDLVDMELYDSLGIPTDNWGATINEETLETGLPGVYIIGDAKGGPATVADAIGDAIRCVKAITRLNTEYYTDLNINPKTYDVMRKRGILYTDCTSVTESERCLECASVCLSCVEVCPNRANISIKADNKTQVIHVDYMCNECGNCEVFCPYSSAPYLNKFTLFANEEDFNDSENDGFLKSGENNVKIRLDEIITEHENGNNLPDGVWDLIQATLERDYLQLRN
jgi:putative selenate reductase